MGVQGFRTDQQFTSTLDNIFGLFLWPVRESGRIFLETVFTVAPFECETRFLSTALDMQLQETDTTYSEQNAQYRCAHCALFSSEFNDFYRSRWRFEVAY